MGPISTGLGEVYWWSVEYCAAGEGAPVRDGKPGWQSDGSYLTPEGERLTDEFQRTVYLRTVQDWIIRPQMKTVPGVAGADAIGGYVKQYQVQPDPARLIGLWAFVRPDVVKAIEANNASRGANYIERNGEGYVVRTSGRVETSGRDRRHRRRDPRRRCRSASRMSPTSRSDANCEPAAPASNGHEVVLGTALMLIGGNSRTVAAAADAKIKEINRTLPPGIRARTVLNRTELVDATIQTVATNLAEGALLVVLVLFLLLGNFRAAVITALVIPDHHADHRDGHAAGQAQRQPDEPRRARLRPDRRRRRHHRGEQPAASGRAPARARPHPVAATNASTPSRRPPRR